MNIYFKHAVLTKIAAIVALLFVALWFTFLLNPESTRAYPALDTGKTLSAVPVLAETAERAVDCHAGEKSPRVDGEARESIWPTVTRPKESRGGAQFISPAQLFVRLIDERPIPWSEPTPIPLVSKESNLFLYAKH